MADIVVCGGSMIGSATAMLLAREGHHVTVLEADPAPVPDEPASAWDTWHRRAVPQFHQPHNLFPRSRQIMEDDLPGLSEGLEAAGAIWMDPIASLPPSITDRAPRAGDERFRFQNARRPVAEAVVAGAAQGHEGVTVRRGISVAGLRATPRNGGPVQVTGVHLANGEDLDADLVVDAMGRRTKLPEWLAAAGAGEPHLESEDSGFVYYTQYLRGPEQPALMGPALTSLGSISILTLRSDNGTWSVTVFGSSSDKTLRPLRDPDVFERVVRAFPRHAHWLDGERISGIETMAGVVDKYRRYVRDGRPLATGVVAAGDAWACTNPSAGRGISIGLIHAQTLRDVAREGLDDAEAFALRFDEATETGVTPFYRNQIAADRVRFAEMEAIRRGEDPAPPDPMMAAVAVAAGQDPDVYRGVIETLTCLALPQEVFARPEIQAAVAPHLGSLPHRATGPDRAELEALLAG